MENGNILVLSERQIMSVLDMPAALESVETSLREIAEGRCINPMKLHMSLRPGIQGYLNSMPSCLLAFLRRMSWEQSLSASIRTTPKTSACL